MYISSKKYTADYTDSSLSIKQSTEESNELLYFNWKQTGFNPVRTYSTAVAAHGQPVKKDIIENTTWIQ